MEDPIISGVVTDMSEAKVTVFGVPDRPGISAALFEPLAAANVNVDMIVQNTSIDGTTDISFTMPMADMNDAEDDRVAGRRGGRCDRRVARQRHRQGVDRRRRHEVVAGHRRQDVPRPRRRGRQHPDDLHLDDPRLGRHRGRRHGTCRTRACTPPSDSTPASTTPPPSPNASRSGSPARGDARSCVGAWHRLHDVNR